jgi:hypothetical protein
MGRHEASVTRLRYRAVSSMCRSSLRDRSLKSSILWLVEETRCRATELS